MICPQIRIPLDNNNRSHLTNLINETENFQYEEINHTEEDNIQIDKFHLINSSILSSTNEICENPTEKFNFNSENIRIQSFKKPNQQLLEWLKVVLEEMII